MRPHRLERLAESVARLAAEFLGRHRGEPLVTVSSARINKSGKAATILLTVYPTEMAGAVLAETRRRRSELRDFLDTRLRGNQLTHIDFALEPLAKL